MKETSKLVCQLRDILLEYLAEHRHISIHGLSKRCGVAPTTLSRIINLETKSDPRPTTVVAIVSALSKETNIHKLVEIYQGPVQECLISAFKSLLPESHYVPEWSDIFGDRMNYIVYKMAANRIGITQKELIDLMGVPVVAAIEELSELKVIFEENGRYHAVKKNFCLPPSVYKKHIPELIRFTQFGSALVKGAIFRNISESINGEAYNSIRAILEEAILKVTHILQSNESNGSVPFFMTVILDTMEASLQED